MSAEHFGALEPYWCMHLSLWFDMHSQVDFGIAVISTEMEGKTMLVKQ